jgi:hypothetical protein
MFCYGDTLKNALNEKMMKNKNETAKFAMNFVE